MKLFGMTEDLLSEFYDIVGEYATSSITLRRNRVAIQSFYQLAAALMIFFIIYFSVRFLSLTIASLGVFLFAMFRLAPRVSTLNKLVYDIESDLPHLVRTHEFANHLEDSQEPDSGSQEVVDEIQTLDFDGVSFSYDSEQVLEDISFRVNQGEFVAFVGQSGAGKSTIVSLLARMYNPESGTIEANGIPISEFDIREWRSEIAMVRQNPHIFNETLRDNLSLSENVPESEMKRVAEIARVTEFLDELPDGYDTVVGDDGVKLSGGQRQRVALARALLTDAELLVLDEATSDLDSDLEQRIHRAIENLDEDRTILAIAHRLSTVRNADTIYTIENGRISEQGTHEDLLAEEGTYAELYSIQ
ncbi:ATP-binding cassette domain-containing protein [Haloarculaceae archaeon H-GB2-1]|nr:ATP-binding cassette domain-containing protein [Haloarculaceae archaeon H-GB11]MEA5406523.1 ATP-binding cassette domain-containing protein [Haloarculaceae archaeon H-GB2-1]